MRSMIYQNSPWNIEKCCMILWIWILISFAKKCSMIYWILLPKAEEGFIELNQCQVNNSWWEVTYYIYPWLLPYKKGTLAGFGDLLNQVFESAFIIGLVKNGPNIPKLGVPWSVGFTFSGLCTQKTTDWYFTGCPLMLNFLKNAYISLNGYFS